MGRQSTPQNPRCQSTCPSTKHPVPTMQGSRARYVPPDEKGVIVAVHDPRTLLARLDELAAHLPFEVTTRPMMGGFIGYADGRTFASLVRRIRNQASRARSGSGARPTRCHATPPFAGRPPEQE